MQRQVWYTLHLINQNTDLGRSLFTILYTHIFENVNTCTRGFWIQSHAFLSQSSTKIQTELDCINRQTSTVAGRWWGILRDKIGPSSVTGNAVTGHWGLQSKYTGTTRFLEHQGSGIGSMICETSLKFKNTHTCTIKSVTLDSSAGAKARLKVLVQTWA